MSNLLIVAPMPFSAASSRGSGAENLATNDPKEVWADTATGAVTLTIDLGAGRPIDTLFLGSITAAVAGTTWSITGGLNGPAEQVIQAAIAARVPDVTGTVAEPGHALWNGVPIVVRYVAVTLNQPAGVAPLSAGVIVVGRAFVAELNHEWGAGRRPIDTANVTSLPSGGFAVVEGARKEAFTWTFGDLSRDEADRLDMIARAVGQSVPALVVEDAARSAGLWARLHYGLFKWKAFERRNRAQTRWEMEIEQWT